MEKLPPPTLVPQKDVNSDSNQNYYFGLFKKIGI